MVVINNKNYELVTNYRDGFDLESVEKFLTDYFDRFDYVFGDWAYGHLRLKGFYKSDNKKVSKINDIANLEKYIKDNCAYDCRYFVLEKKELVKTT